MRFTYIAMYQDGTLAIRHEAERHALMHTDADAVAEYDNVTRAATILQSEGRPCLRIAAEATEGDE
jgi:hypothetical protein